MRVHRRPVRPMHATIASNSISPYMWIVSGPRSIAPLPGDGIDAISAATGTGFCPCSRSPASLAEDVERRFGRAAALDEVDRAMEVDVDASSELGGRSGLVAGALERLRAP